LYLRLVKENLKESGIRVLAYCLMTNHVHFVVIPEREDSLPLLFGRANGRYAPAVNIRKAGPDTCGRRDSIPARCRRAISGWDCVTWNAIRAGREWFDCLRSMPGRVLEYI
jgi:putative transposase